MQRSDSRLRARGEHLLRGERLWCIPTSWCVCWGGMRSSLLPLLLGNRTPSAAQQLRKSPKRMVAAACMETLGFPPGNVGVFSFLAKQLCEYSRAGLEEPSLPLLWVLGRCFWHHWAAQLLIFLLLFLQ